MWKRILLFYKINETFCKESEKKNFFLWQGVFQYTQIKSKIKTFSILNKKYPNNNIYNNYPLMQINFMGKKYCTHLEKNNEMRSYEIRSQTMIKLIQNHASKTCILKRGKKNVWFQKISLCLYNIKMKY